MKKRISLNEIFLFILFVCFPLVVFGAEESIATSLHEKPSQAPDKIEVIPQTRDHEIGERLNNIMHSTNWFNDPKVKVENGVVFLTGETTHHQFKDWATELAHNTQDVAAIVNKIEVLEPSIIDLHIIIQDLLNHWKKIIRSLPMIIYGTAILLLAWLLARLVYKLIPFILRDKMNPTLLHEVIARAAGFLVFLMGVYFIFEMADLTTMALTIVSGTGLLGIILGIAFRDLAENFLASILLSLQNPFKAHDLIDLVCPSSGYTVTGYVERLTMRVTVLLSLDGNHLQIPNATVYKSNIINHSSNPNHQETFLISVSNNRIISATVDEALKILSDNEAILKNPEPLVLVEELEKESVKLKISYWIDIKKYNSAKVKSSIMRLINEAANDQSEKKLKSSSTGRNKGLRHSEAKTAKSEVKTKGDAQLEKIKGFSNESRSPEEGKNFLGKPG